MPIPILCPCTAKLRVRDGLAGLEVQCPKCQAVHAVPGEGPSNGRAEPPDDAGLVLTKSGFSASERGRLEQELEEGERLLWAAKPDTRAPYLLGLVAAAGCLVFASVLLVIAVLSRVQGLGGIGVTVVLGVLALVPLVVGAAFPFLNRLRYQRTAYALTDRRALVWDCDWMARPRFKDYGPEDLASYAKWQFSQRADAVGHLVFAREVTGEVGRGKLIRSHGFFYVAGVPQLERLLREEILDAYTDRLMQ
jgi:hypothetical protein